MAEIGNNLKNIWMKGMEAIGNTASNIASNTRFKVDEMNMVNRRTEILKDFGAKAYALWQKGEHFPQELEEQLQELGKLDEKLNDLRAERFAGIQTKESAANTEDLLQVSEDENTNIAQDAIAVDSEELHSGYNSEEEITEKSDGSDSEDEVPVIHVESPENNQMESSPLSNVINDLFEKIPTAEETADMVNSSLDSLENGIKKFSKDLDVKIEELNDRIQNG